MRGPLRCARAFASSTSDYAKALIEAGYPSPAAVLAVYAEVAHVDNDA